MIDYEEVQKRRVELTRGPVFAIPEDRMAEVYKRIEERCPGSRQVYEVALKHIPGGAQPMRVNKVPYPITVRRALGSKIWDVDGVGESRSASGLAMTGSRRPVPDFDKLPLRHG